MLIFDGVASQGGNSEYHTPSSTKTKINLTVVNDFFSHTDSLNINKDTDKESETTSIKEVYEEAISEFVEIILVAVFKVHHIELRLADKKWL